MRKYLTICILIIISDICFGQDLFLDYIYKIKPKTNISEYSRSGLDSIVNYGKYAIIDDSTTIYGFENQGYIKNKYLKILDYMITRQAGFVINEYKIIEFKGKEYLFYSKTMGVNGYSDPYFYDSLFIYQIENSELIIDKKLTLTVDKYRDSKFFTDNKKLFKSKDKEDFKYEFEENDNEISIIISIDYQTYNEIEEELEGTRLILRFNEKIETELTEKPRIAG